MIYDEIVFHLKKGEVLIERFGTFSVTPYKKMHPILTGRPPANRRMETKYVIKKQTMHKINFSPHQYLKAKMKRK